MAVLRLASDGRYGPMELRTGRDVEAHYSWADAVLSMDGVNIALDMRRLRWLQSAGLPTVINHLEKDGSASAHARPP